MGWCQASFYPTEWDEHGEVTHVLFAVSTIDKDRAKNIEEGISSQRNLDGIFNVAPSGIAVYEWDGNELRFLNTNKRYRDLFEYGDLKEGDVPTFTPFHPDDLIGYQKAIIKALTKTHHLEYVFRIWDKKKKYYRWIQNNAVAKPREDGTSIVYAIFTDITKQEKLEQSYLERLRVLQKSNADALCMVDVNLTKNRFHNVQAEGIIKQYCESSDTVDEVMMKSSNTVIDPEEQKQYRDIFKCEAMLKKFEQGETHIQFDHFYRANEKHTMMVETGFDLIREPITGDVIEIAYAKDLNKKNVSDILLNVALQKDYPMAALLYVDTGEYYYYEVDRGNYCVHTWMFN